MGGKRTFVQPAMTRSPKVHAPPPAAADLAQLGARLPASMPFPRYIRHGSPLDEATRAGVLFNVLERQRYCMRVVVAEGKQNMHRERLPLLHNPAQALSQPAVGQ